MLQFYIFKIMRNLYYKKLRSNLIKWIVPFLLIKIKGGKINDKKIIYDPIIIPNMENELDLDEIGLLASMINNAEADYKDTHTLSVIRCTKKRN